MKYPFDEIESKWRKYWEENKVYETDLTDDENKLYSLVMFIYPSGAKLHIGHWYNYGPNDSWARLQVLKGKNVFEPIGYDAFGLPAENYAIKTGIHPYESTLNNIKDIREQLKKMGGMFDWNSELMTCDPNYYKWNQWFFLQLYQKGLAYKKEAPVNWDPVDQTVLANEQVLPDGTAERSGAKVEKKMLSQWFFKITRYAEELLSGLDKIDWPEKTKTMQRNWIGKSTGTEIMFSVDGYNEHFKVFTTRPDTLFGAAYVVLAPENELVKRIITDEQKEAVQKYIDETVNLSEIDRTSTVKEKTGVFTGAYAINPINEERIPIWVADYVLSTYGTGCVMAVPGHDERDFEFASKFGLPIRKVVLEPDTKEEDELTEAYTGPGELVNSGNFNLLKTEDAKEQITEELHRMGLGEKKVNFRLRDWLISRQRYWGTPIPIIYCGKCGEVPVPEEDLPVELPKDADFKLGGGSPLARHKEFLNVKCPQCGADAKRDPDTMDTFVDSSWYYLRYLNPNLKYEMFDSELADKWTPVDMYVGGSEHAVLHLLYARFFHKALRDMGMVNSDEPFQKLLHQGTITSEGAKMSKSKGNVVNPDDFTKVYGSDVFRMYLMFMGPYELGGDWSDKGIVGVDRFVQRTYQLFNSSENVWTENTPPDKFDLAGLNESEKVVYRKVNQSLAKVEEEIDNFRFNTAVAQLMELLNDLTKYLEDCCGEMKAYALERYIVMLAPLAPHLAEEGNEIIGKVNTLFEYPVWYEVDKSALVMDSVVIAVQVNGKLRAKIDVPVDAPEEEVKEMVFSEDNVKAHTAGKSIVKEIFVPGKIYNIVVK